MDAGGWIAWIFAGLIAGWLSGKVMRGEGYGFFGDTILGLIGALVGGFVTGLFVNGTAGFWGTIIVAFIGACILVAISRAVNPHRVQH
jgi:uncharacterized membrane protein YeaQ/YmgE (transglycosylase-associated protein family)